MQSAGQQCNCRALYRSRAQHLRPPQVFRRPFPKLAGRRQQACTCSAEHRCTCSAEQRHADLSRREALLAFGGAAAVALTPLPSSAEEGGPALLQAVTLGCIHHPRIPRPEDCHNSLQKQRPCMAEPPRPPAMVAMEAMLRRLQSEAVNLPSIHKTFRLNARLAGSSAAICRYTFEYPATWKLDTVNKVGPHGRACAVSSTCHLFHLCLCVPPYIAWAGL